MNRRRALTQFVILGSIVGSIASSATGAPAAKEAAGEPRTFTQILTTRPAPSLDGLAERSSPGAKGDDVTESFWDLLKLGQSPNAAAVPELIKVLESHEIPANPAEANRIHRFAAAQALHCIGIDEARRALEKHLARPEFPVELAIGYTSHWEMAEPKRSEFIEKYLLRHLSEDLAVSAKARWVEGGADAAGAAAAGGRSLRVTVTLTNKSDRAIVVQIRPQPVLAVHLRSPDGAFIPRGGLMMHEHMQRPRWAMLEPNASDQFEVSLPLTQDRETLDRFGPMRPKAVLDGSGLALGVPEFGKHRLSVMIFQPPLTEQQMAALRQDGIPRAGRIWTGRAVSAPIEVEIADPAPR